MQQLWLKSNLDDLRHRRCITETSDRMEWVQLIHMDGVIVVAEPPERLDAEEIPRRGDVVEVIVEVPTRIQVGHVVILLNPGRWMIPLCYCVFLSVRLLDPCRIQHFHFADHTIRVTLCRLPWYQKIGDTVLIFANTGLAKYDPEDIIDVFCYRPHTVGTGIFSVTVRSRIHDRVTDCYAEIQRCPSVEKCSKPAAAAWFVAAEDEPAMSFVIKTRDPKSVEEWLSSYDVTVDVCENIEIRQPTDIEKERHRVAVIQEHIEGLRKLVELGILEPFE